MASLVQHSEQRRGQEFLVPARGNPTIIRSNGRTKRMIGCIEPPTLEIKADATGNFPNEPLLIGDRKQSFENGVVGPLRRGHTLLYQRHDLVAEALKKRRNNLPSRSWFVVVHERVVWIEIGSLAGSLLGFESKHFHQPGLQYLPRRLRSRGCPSLLRLDSCFSQRLDKLHRQAGMFGKIFLQNPNGCTHGRWSVFG